MFEIHVGIGSFLGFIEKFNQNTIAPQAAERDLKQIFPKDGILSLGQAGLLCAVLSEDQGGSGVGRSDFASMVTEAAKACASTALIWVSHVIVAKALEAAAPETIRKKWLPLMAKGQALGAIAVHEPDSGCNAGAITTRAQKEQGHYRVNGSKIFITSAGEAQIYLVLVRTDPEKGPQGMSLLLIEKDTEGFTFGRIEDRLGMRSSSSRELFFDDCRVPIENLIGMEGGWAEVMGKSMMGWGFFGAAAIAVGLAISASELAIKHARERMIAGQPIGVHQAVQFMISDMVLGTESAEAYLSDCAARADAFPEKAVINGFKAKLLASEMAIEVTNKAIQVLGGHGYCRDYMVERLFRDARGLTLHFKTSEWLRQDIAKAAIGL
ncbi:MAG: acyl-CoA dehydrogenase family protein [Deltaproteobacteria bacterium]|nr:acyl-CoA dehydrogenase family protein [Deltaproteobacteria bacterium]